ncbi:hypothetical protein QBC33DRAFT_547638 [Phialemonium atrogriseum]|uniref:Indole-diterpene biosynthesis protein PaxU n=1 Tax=Phialemonium atrogriseum TaxID=1093897 RepID=A0AAJ0BU51_9PEZI|nr:uncharacterized protein QBC33DRAFT_547638 [Phialemonium atrogriseum]KAK1764266.1 hypothetical protein QBC33DRAFT_547638 [Phialemonium atrogriseum]
MAMITKLSPFVSFYEPAETPAQNSAGAVTPKLIVVASWMDARDPHVAKYIARYQALYPTSKVLIVKFIFKQMLFESTVTKAMQPAVSYLRSQLDSGYLSVSPSRPEILVHLFSNGGIASTKALFNSYRRQTGHAFPIHATVYDSCPGQYSYAATQDAVMAGVPKGIRRWIVGFLVHLLNAYVWIIIRLGRPDRLAANSKFHNDPEENRETNRAYIYGAKDVMVDWRHVEIHAKQAEARGFVVRKELFQDGLHVAHVRSDETRYWKIVTETWERARLGV